LQKAITTTTTTTTTRRSEKANMRSGTDQRSSISLDSLIWTLVWMFMANRAY